MEMETEEKGEECEIYRDEEGLESKVHDILSRHASFWEEMGVSDYALSVIRNGIYLYWWGGLQIIRSPITYSILRRGFG